MGKEIRIAVFVLLVVCVLCFICVLVPVFYALNNYGSCALDI